MPDEWGYRYDIVSGSTLWTKFDPLGLQGGRTYSPAVREMKARQREATINAIKGAPSYVANSFAENFSEPGSLIAGGFKGEFDGLNAQAVGVGVLALGAATVETGLDIVTGGATKPGKQALKQGAKELGETVVEGMAKEAVETTVETSAKKTALKGGANPRTRKAAARGSQLHSDKPGNLPDQLRDKFPETTFEFTKPGVKGQDVQVVDGMHPSFVDENWPAGVNLADFKPNTKSGTRTFNQDQRKKWDEPTHKLNYDPESGELVD